MRNKESRKLRIRKPYGAKSFMKSAWKIYMKLLEVIVHYHGIEVCHMSSGLEET